MATTPTVPQVRKGEESSP
ncbi:hypothetical protein E2C01_093703 [Portunus trituberculatus]|uniref:Uncharacterized protein n=1 Tax=Portunus trituberculatus TaxID=210409 RepID=A0A5B7JYV4_PORTR|nr:hypothetical protein [Portunus trituberculatus]